MARKKKTVEHAPRQRRTAKRRRVERACRQSLSLAPREEVAADRYRTACDNLGAASLRPGTYARGQSVGGRGLLVRIPRLWGVA